MFGKIATELISGVRSKLDEGLLGVAWLLLDIEGLAWGWQALTGTALLTGTLGLTAGTAAIVYALVGIAAIVSIGHDVLDYSAKV